MKKILCILLVSVLFLTSCGGGKLPKDLSCNEILDTVLEVVEETKAEKSYTKLHDNLNKESLSLWADGLYEECEDIEVIADYALYLGVGTETFEVSILKAKDKKGVKVLENLIERRKKTLSMGDKGMYDPHFETKMENSVIIKDGLFVIFLLTNENDAAIKAISGLEE